VRGLCGGGGAVGPPACEDVEEYSRPLHAREAGSDSSRSSDRSHPRSWPNPGLRREHCSPVGAEAEVSFV
jgi:hypothetical protein